MASPIDPTRVSRPAPGSRSGAPPGPAALAIAGAGLLGGLSLQQLSGQPDHAWPSNPACASASTLPSSSWTLILPTSVIAVLLSLDPKHRRS
jgi:hypothetical protein